MSRVSSNSDLNKAFVNDISAAQRTGTLSYVCRPTGILRFTR